MPFSRRLCQKLGEEVHTHIHKSPAFNISLFDHPMLFEKGKKKKKKEKKEKKKKKKLLKVFPNLTRWPIVDPFPFEKFASS